jgi:hypothetical protein
MQHFAGGWSKSRFWFFCAAAVALGLLGASPPASAHRAPTPWLDVAARAPYPLVVAAHERAHGARSRGVHSVQSWRHVRLADIPRYAAPAEPRERPADCHGIPWCGCFMRHLMGLADTSLNLAANWRLVGHATAPVPGAIVVWWHHVGRLGAACGRGHFLVLSGNDGGRVRERCRSVAGAIAFRSL